MAVSVTLSAMLLVSQFLGNVEQSPALRASMEQADGDVQQIVALAQNMGYQFNAEQFMQAVAQQHAAEVARSGHPEVYFAAEETARSGHPEVYFAAEESARSGHPEVYFAAEEVARSGHPEVYFAAEESTRSGHPEVYFTE